MSAHAHTVTTTVTNTMNTIDFPSVRGRGPLSARMLRVVIQRWSAPSYLRVNEAIVRSIALARRLGAYFPFGWSLFVDRSFFVNIPLCYEAAMDADAR
jgi:hypothetical protein